MEQLPDWQSQSDEQLPCEGTVPAEAQHVSVLNPQTVDAQKHPPGTTQASPAPTSGAGHSLAHAPLLHPW